MAAHQFSNAVLVFEKTEFDVVDVHNIPWLRGQQVAGALGYKNPRQAIDDLFSRNSDEFNADMTQVVELQTAGGIQPVRIFSPRGCYLLGMLARTEKAKAFRAWALDVLECRVLPLAMKPLSVAQLLATQRHVMGLLKAIKDETSPGVRRVQHAQLTQSCRLLSIECPALVEIGRDAPQRDELLAEFWEIFDALQEHLGGKLNHARDPKLLAINLPQVRAVATTAKMVLPEIGELRAALKHSTAPRFIDVKAMNSIQNKNTVKCWVFERDVAAGEEG